MLHTYIHAYVRPSVRTYIHACIHTYIYIHTCFNTFIHTHTYIHTYIHTLSRNVPIMFSDMIFTDQPKPLVIFLVFCLNTKTSVQSIQSFT